MFFPFFYDPTFILILPALIFAMIAQSRVQSTFARYLRVRSRAGVTGAQAAAGILSSSGLHHVSIEQTPHTLGDHYDPRTNTLRLSPQVYGGSSLASIAVAAHEAGHALQHREGYAPLQFRQTLLPVASIGSNLAVPLFILGFLFSAGRGSFGEFLMNPRDLAVRRSGGIPDRHAACGVQRSKRALLSWLTTLHHPGRDRRSKEVLRLRH